MSGIAEIVAGAIQGTANTGVSIANTVNAFQTQAWNKYAQQKTWDREDTAIQRRVADLKAAGLSPVLAAGTGASSSSPIQIKPAEVSNPNLGAALDAAKSVQSMRTVAEQNRLLKSQREQVEAQTAGQQITNARNDVQLNLDKVNLATAQHDFGLTVDSGMKSNASGAAGNWANFFHGVFGKDSGSGVRDATSSALDAFKAPQRAAQAAQKQYAEIKAENEKKAAETRNWLKSKYDQFKNWQKSNNDKRGAKTARR